MRKVKDLISLQGRVSLVTGAAGHIGSSVADSLAELGSDLVILDVEGGRLKSLASRLQSEYGVRVLDFVVDLEKEEQIAGIPRKVETALGRLDVVVNNAAFVGTTGLAGWAEPFEKQTSDTWRRALEVNLTSVFCLCQSFLPLLKASGNGSIVNIASIYGVLGPDLSLYQGTSMHNPAAYAASKGGLLQLSRWMATVMAPDVRVNSVSPGGVFREQDPTFVERYEKRTPLKRMANEEDFKGVVSFLASDMSKYITGQNIMVDGGWSCW